MRHMTFFRFSLSIAILYLLFNSESGDSVTQDAKRNTIFMPYMMSVLPNPFDIVWTGDWAACQHGWATLVDASETGHMKPRLAESWTLTPDGLKWFFKLKPDLKWSDGSQMTPEQVVISLKASWKGTSHTDLSSAIKDIVSIGNTIQFELTKPIPLLLVNLAYIDWAIVHPSTFKTENGHTELTASEPCSGSFCIESTKKNGPLNEINLKINPHSAPPLQLPIQSGRLKFFERCDELLKQSNRMLSFRSFSYQMNPSCKEKLSKDFNIFLSAPTWIIGARYTDRGIEELDKTLRQSIFIELRKRLRSQLKDSGDSGLIEATGLLPPYLLGTIPLNEFDQILKSMESSIPPNTLNRFKGKTITILSIELWTRWKSFDWLVTSLKSLGLNVEPIIMEKTTLFKKMADKTLAREGHLLFMPKGVGDIDPDGSWQMASKNFFTGQVDQSIVTKAFFESDEKKRIEIYKSLGQKLLEDAVWIPLVVDADFVGVHKSVKMGDVAQFKVGLTIHDLLPASIK